MSKIQAVQHFRTSDDEVFLTIEAAEAHQFYLDNKEAIAKKVNAFLNTNKLFGRRRASFENVATQMVSFLLQFDGQAVDFDHEAAEAEAKAAAEAAKAAETANTETPEAVQDAVDADQL